MCRDAVPAVESILLRPSVGSREVVLNLRIRDERKATMKRLGSILVLVLFAASSAAAQAPAAK